MEHAKKILYIGIVFIFLTGIICFTYTRKVSLKEPVFLKHYSEFLFPFIAKEDRLTKEDITQLNGQSDMFYTDLQFVLQYLTNRDNTSVTKLDLGLGDEFEVVVSDQPFTPQYSYSYDLVSDGAADSYGLYQLHPLYVYIMYTKEAPPNESILITDAQVTYSDGTTDQINLGKIMLRFADEHTIYESETLSLLGETSFANQYLFEYDIASALAECSFYDEIASNLTLLSNKTSFKSGDTLQIKKDCILDMMLIQPKGDILTRYTTYNINLSLTYEDNQVTKQLIIPLTNYGNDMVFTYGNIRNYLSQRGDIE